MSLYVYEVGQLTFVFQLWDNNATTPPYLEMFVRFEARRTQLHTGLLSVYRGSN